MPTKKGAFSPDNLAPEKEYGARKYGTGEYPGGVGPYAGGGKGSVKDGGPYSDTGLNLDYRSEYGTAGETPGGTYALTGVFGPEENDGFSAPVPRKPGHKRL